MSRLMFVSSLLIVPGFYVLGNAPGGHSDPPARDKPFPAGTQPAAKQAVPARDKLYQPFNIENGIAPGTSLHDVLKMITDRFDLEILVDTAAFKEAGQEAIEDQQVQLPKMVGVALDTVLRQVASQVNGKYLLRPDHIEITTQRRWAEAVWGRALLAGEASEPGRRRSELPCVCVAIKGRPLDSALRELTTRTGVSVLLDYRRAAEHATHSVTATMDNVPLDSAVRVLASQANLDVIVLPDMLYVTTPDHARAFQAILYPPTSTASLAPAAAAVQRLRQPVSVNFQSAPLRTALEIVARETGTQIVINPGTGALPDRDVTLHLKDVALETAVRVATAMVDLKPVRIGEVLFVTTPGNAESLQAEQDKAFKTAAAGFGNEGQAGGLGVGIGGGLLGVLGGDLNAGSRVPLQIYAGPPQSVKPPGPRSNKSKPPTKPQAAPPNPTQTTPLTRLGQKVAQVVTLEKGIDNSPLNQVLDFLADRYDVTILLDTGAFAAAGANPLDTPVQLPAMHGVRLGTVLEKVASQVDGAYLVRPDYIALTTLQAWRQEVWGRPDEETALKQRHLPLVHLTFEQRPLDEVAHELAHATGISIVLDAEQAGERARAPVTALLNNVPLDTALRLVADQADLHAVLLDDVFQVTTAARARALRAAQERANRNGIDLLPSNQAPPGR